MRTLFLAGLAYLFAAVTAGGAEARDRIGDFDYYLLSLSWAPDYCKTHQSDTAECGAGKRLGFVVHGLWPQRDRGPYPHDCIAPAPTVPPAAIDIAVQGNPSWQLFADHEWPKHGTCATDNPVAYAQSEIDAFRKVTIPDRLKGLTTPARISLNGLKGMLLQANPALSDASLKVQCDRGGALQEIRVCLDKSLNPRACASNVRDACPSSLLIDPVQ